jgi:hypothetical protein
MAFVARKKGKPKKKHDDFMIDDSGFTLLLFFLESAE